MGPEPYGYLTSRTSICHCTPPSLRVAVSGFVVIIIVFFLAVVFVFLFLLFLVRLLPKEEIGNQEIRSGRIVAFWMYCGHGQMVRLCALANAGISNASAGLNTGES